MSTTDECATSAEAIVRPMSPLDAPVSPSDQDHLHDPDNGSNTGVPEGSSITESAMDKQGAPLLSAPGLHWIMAGFFLVGEVAGGGMLALSYVCTQTGFIGPVLVLMLSLVSAGSGLCLAESWVILEERHPDLAGRCRKPYPEIVARALGPAGGVFTSVCIVIGGLGISIVLFIMSSQMLAGMLAPYIPLTYCHWAVILIVVMTPFSWFGTPADFGFIAVVAVLSTVLTWVLAMITTLINFSTLHEGATYSNPTALSLVRGLGPIMFANAGASTFPTVQNDMKDRNRFSRSVILGFTIIIGMYVPLSALGFWAMGDNQKPNILTTLRTRVGGPLPIAAEILILFHLLSAFFISMNPSVQQLEDLVHVPHKFGVLRIILRTLVMAFLLFLALLIPDFIRVMDLISATVIVATAFALPTISRLKLEIDSQHRVEDEGTVPYHTRNRKPLPVWKKAFLILVPILGVIVAIVSTISAVEDIVEHGTGSSCLLAAGSAGVWSQSK